MASATEYKQAIQVVQENQKIFEMGEAIQCMDRSCNSSNVYSDSGALALEAASGLAYLGNDKNDFLGKAQRLIGKFTPKEDVKSFHTMVLLVKAQLCKIKKEWSQQSEDELNKNLEEFSKEMEDIRVQMDTMQHATQSAKVRGILETLVLRAAPIYTDNGFLCFAKKCGCMGHGNPSREKIDSCRRLKRQSEGLKSALNAVEAYAGPIIGGMDKASDILKVLKDSSPAKEPDRALQQLDKLEAQWESLKAALA